MKLTDKEGLEIASVVKDVLEGKAVKKEKKNVKEVEEPRPEGEKEFKKKHVIKKSGEKEDGTVAKEAASPEEKAQQALKHAKEKEGLKKKQDQEKERLNAKEEVEVEEKVTAAESKKEKYQKFFQAALKKFGVKSPAELEGDKKKEFFDYVDKNYEADNEAD
tara:strand:- start:3788 stop:4273 length:486 start_codon:yes stop_codon:yes gene_type:complete